MNPELFFDNFDLLADSPNGIQKLREMILQMAVQGKLVEQNPDDEPAEVLLERIRAEKARLVKEGKIRKSKALPAIEDGDISYVLPDNWKWVRLGEIIELISGQDRTPSEYNGEGIGIPYITGASNIQQNNLIINRWIAKSNTISIKDDLLITCKGTVGTTLILENEQVHIARQIMAVRSHGLNNIKYIKVFIDGYVSFLISSAKSLIPGISRNDILNIVFPLPPLEEQKRIVAKVDQLMALCDQLESLQQKKNESRIQLNTSALNKMLDAGSPEEFVEHWQLVCENFDLLYDDLDNLEKLRQAILQLAVQGKLVEQDASDEPAGMLLEKIKSEKERLIKEKKIRKTKSIPSVDSENGLSELPSGWQWTKLDHICNLITDGTHHTPTYVSNGIPFLSVKDVSGGFIDLSSTRFISEDEHETLIKRCNPEFEDVLLTKVGTTGIAKVIDIDVDFSIFVSLALLKISKEYLYPYYLELVINSPLVKEQSEKNTQGVGNKNLVLKHIKNFDVPLPPLEEQKRIVVKVDYLMSLCDQIETRLKQAQSEGNLLMEVAVNHLLEV